MRALILAVGMSALVAASALSVADPYAYAGEAAGCTTDTDCEEMYGADDAADWPASDLPTARAE